jgi:hypothetical protein
VVAKGEIYGNYLVTSSNDAFRSGHVSEASFPDGLPGLKGHPFPPLKNASLVGVVYFLLCLFCCRARRKSASPHFQ